MNIELPKIFVKFANGEMYTGTSPELADAQMAEDLERKEWQKEWQKSEAERRTQLTSHQLAAALLAQPDQPVLVSSNVSIVRAGAVIKTQDGIYIGDSEYEPEVFRTSHGLVIQNHEFLGEGEQLGDGNPIQGARLF